MNIFEISPKYFMCIISLKTYFVRKLIFPVLYIKKKMKERNEIPKLFTDITNHKKNVITMDYLVLYYIFND